VSRSLDDLIRAMSDPAIYPHRPAGVEVIQTHISVVFIAGDLVYKVKKPVNFGFLDYTTLEKRQHFCHQEVILNSRFSERIYLGVVEICSGPGGINLRGGGDAVEAAVVMRHIPQDRTMIRMLEDDKITPEILDRLADRLAFFHSVAATGPEISLFGSSDVIRRNLAENFEQTVPFVGSTIDRETHEAVVSLSFAFLETHEDLIAMRMKGGFIRDCHGDLHLEHVVILDEIMLYDCIEFNDRFRYSDTASDLGFLLMDLDFRGYPAYADRIARRYARTSGDRDVLKLLGLYRSYRAFVRGKVLSFSLEEPEISPEEKAAAAGTATDYFRLARSYLVPPLHPALIVTSGLMASGKSFMAAQLAKRLGIVPLRSDEVRKELHGLTPAEHQLDKFRQGIYTPGATDLTYRALLDEARRELEQGKSVIVDASFSRLADRKAALEVAQAAGARFRLIECTAPDDVIRSRLTARAGKRDEPSDGRWEIFPQHKAAYEPVRAEESSYHGIWDSTTSLNLFLTSFVRELLFF